MEIKLHEITIRELTAGYEDKGDDDDTDGVAPVQPLCNWACEGTLGCLGRPHHACWCVRRSSRRGQDAHQRFLRAVEGDGHF